MEGLEEASIPFKNPVSCDHTTSKGYCSRQAVSIPFKNPVSCHANLTEVTSMLASRFNPVQKSGQLSPLR